MLQIDLSIEGGTISEKEKKRFRKKNNIDTKKILLLIKTT